MSESIKQSTVAQKELQNYKARLQRAHDRQVQEIEEQHADRMQRTMMNQSENLKSLKEAYDVQISKEAEAMQARLNQVRAENETQANEEKKAGDARVDAIKMDNAKRVADERIKSEDEITRLRSEMGSATRRIHDRAKRDVQIINQRRGIEET